MFWREIFGCKILEGQSPEIEAVCAEHKKVGGDFLSDGNLLLNGAPLSWANEQFWIGGGGAVAGLSFVFETADNENNAGRHVSHIIPVCMYSRAGVIVPYEAGGNIGA